MRLRLFSSPRINIDFSRWFVDIDPKVARDRLARRHLNAGIEKTLKNAIARAEDNDLPNGDLIRSKLVKPDVRVVS